MIYTQNLLSFVVLAISSYVRLIEENFAVFVIYCFKDSGNFSVLFVQIVTLL